MIKTIGFIGLGVMGLPQACNLAKANFEVIGFNRSRPERLNRLVAAGGKLSDSIAETVRTADVVITMLPDVPDVEQVILGSGGVADNVKPGTLIIDMSTMSPIFVRELHDKLEVRGLRILDAPVSGGQPKATDGTLSIMVGGSQENFEEALPVFQAMGTNINLIGGIGAGNICKICNQLLVMANMASVSETLTFAAKAGADPELVFKAVRTGLAGSTILDVNGPRMFAGNIDPGGVLKYHMKDLKNAFAIALETNMPMPVHAVARDIIQSCMADGLGDADHSCLIRYYEKITGTKVRKT